MPTLTFKAIRENPWNAVSHRLPFFFDETLLELTEIAVDYCRYSEGVFLHALRDDATGLKKAFPPDTETWCEARLYAARRRYDKIGSIYFRKFVEHLD